MVHCEAAPCSKSFKLALRRWMLPVLDFDPVATASALIWPVSPLGHQSLKPDVAGRSKQIRPKLTAFEGIEEDTFRTPRQKAL